MGSGRFRSPLRNEWQAIEPKFHASARGDGQLAVTSRMMLDIMPVFIDAYERERDFKTSPHHFFDAVAAACGAMITEAIEQHSAINLATPQASLDRMLHGIHRGVAPNIAAPNPSRIIRPEF